MDGKKARHDEEEEVGSEGAFVEIVGCVVLPNLKEAAPSSVGDRLALQGASKQVHARGVGVVAWVVFAWEAGKRQGCAREVQSWQGWGREMVEH